MRLLKEIHNLIGNYHVKSGLYHYHRNEYKQAEEFFRKALKDEDQMARSDLRNARHHLTLSLMDHGEKLFATGEVESAIEQLRQAVEVSPGFPDLYYRLGLMLEKVERWDDAVAEYNRAIECHEGYVDAQVALGFCHLEAGRGDESCVAFRKALALKQERLEAAFQEGADLLERGESRAAADRFHEAFRASPMLCRDHVKKANTWLKDEEYEKCLGELDRALDLSPNYPDLHNQRGVVLCELERLEEAIAAFRVSAKLSPRYMAPRLNLAFALVRAEEYRSAEQELESILRLDPTEPAASAKLEELRSGRMPEKRRPVTRGGTR